MGDSFTSCVGVLKVQLLRLRMNTSLAVAVGVKQRELTQFGLASGGKLYRWPLRCTRLGVAGEILDQSP